MKTQIILPVSTLAKTTAIFAVSLFFALAFSNVSESVAATPMGKAIESSHTSHRMLEELEQNSYQEDAHHAMMERNANGNFGEVYADFTE